MRFAVLGAGRMGQTHGKALLRVDDAELAAVYDPVAAAAEAMQHDYGCDIRSVEAIAEARDIDAVIICTPTDTHADMIELFARAGKAVFCEKPIDLSVDRVRGCLAVVAATKAPLMIGFNRRFDPDFAALKAQIDADAIGAVEMVSITSRDPGAPPADYIARSGGIFRDMTVHDFDIARWLLGEEITSVMARGSVLTDPEIEALGDFDSVSILMTTASGKHCTISNSRRASYGYDQRIEVHGARGMVSVANAHESRVTVAGAHGFSTPPLQNFFMTRYAAAYEAEISAFVHAVQTGAPMPVAGEDGLAAMRLAEAALASARKGRAVTP